MNMAWLKYLMMSIALGVTLSHDAYAFVVLNGCDSFISQQS